MKVILIIKKIEKRNKPIWKFKEKEKKLRKTLILRSKLILSESEINSNWKI